jgi:hypothetical protein
MINNRHIYKLPNTQIHKDWFAKILFGIHLAVHRYIHNCGYCKHFADIDLDQLANDLNQIKNNVQQQSVNTILPKIFTNKSLSDHVLYLR